MSATFPAYRPMAEHGLLVEFGDRIAESIHAQVLLLDQRIAEQPPAGFREAVPAYASLLVYFDPLLTDHATLRLALQALLSQPMQPTVSTTVRRIGVCYDADLAPDLATVAKQTGLSTEAVIGAHISAEYAVYMYGFAPGYAYLAGTPAPIRMPRKESAVRGVAAGSVLIAGPQCLVSTLTMPTGWWIIGRSPTRIIGEDPDRPFLFDVGDRVKFHRLTRTQFEGGAAG